MNTNHHTDHHHGHDKPVHVDPIQIIVNGTRKTVLTDHLSFQQLIHLEFPNSPPNTEYTVTYDKGPKENREGTMSAGDVVKLKEGMVFNVVDTTKS